ncbi:caspase family protein [Streptomyces acidiscabies]|uniref:caspase family protein n=1 Tax=Streptomyces acidiscabies TaxID=42234 RepID=UPI0030CCBE1A
MRECRRFFIALGVERYLNLPEHEQLGSVPSDIRAVRELLAGFGYQHVLPGLGEYESADQIRQKLRHWSADVALTPDDVVVFYYAGHGLVQDRDRHYLLCWDSRDDEDAATTALATEDLVRILCRGDLSHLLLVLDTCAGGAGSADATALALQTIAYRRGGSGTAGGLWFLASARRKDLAEEGWFATVLPAAVRVTTERTGQRQQFLDLTELVKAVNERFEADGTGQRAELASGLVTGLAPFLPNADYREALPPIGTDLELQRRAATLDLVDHFGPRSRGVEFESEHGLYFSGRTRVLTELTRWLSAPEGDGRGRVITGPPGCGKSAVLGRVVALSDPGYRARFDLDALDPATVVPESCVTAAVHARHKRLDEIVERIAVHLGIDVDGTAALLQELTRRGRAGSPTVIVVDAVDEAGSDTAADAGGHGEPRRITRELLRPLSEIPGVRLLVGTRPELVGPLGATFHPIDLDRPGYRAERTDVAGYVTKMLLAEEEPQVPSPYRDRPALARRSRSRSPPRPPGCSSTPGPRPAPCALTAPPSTSTAPAGPTICPARSARRSTTTSPASAPTNPGSAACSSRSPSPKAPACPGAGSGPPSPPPSPAENAQKAISLGCWTSPARTSPKSSTTTGARCTGSTTRPSRNTCAGPPGGPPPRSRPPSTGPSSTSFPPSPTAAGTGSPRRPTYGSTSPPTRRRPTSSPTSSPTRVSCWPANPWACYGRWRPSTARRHAGSARRTNKSPTASPPTGSSATAPPTFSSPRGAARPMNSPSASTGWGFRCRGPRGGRGGRRAVRIGC